MRYTVALVRNINSMEETHTFNGPLDELIKKCSNIKNSVAIYLYDSQEYCIGWREFGKWSINQ